MKKEGEDIFSSSTRYAYFRAVEDERKWVSPRSRTLIVGRQGVIMNGRMGIRETGFRVRMLRRAVQGFKMVAHFQNNISGRGLWTLTLLTWILYFYFLCDASTMNGNNETSIDIQRNFRSNGRITNNRTNRQHTAWKEPKHFELEKRNDDTKRCTNFGHFYHIFRLKELTRYR